MSDKKNTFGSYKFPDWVPDDERELISSFWGIFGRTYRDWLKCNYNQVNLCSHGPGANGFGSPPNFSMVEYIIRDYKVSKDNNAELFRVVRGRYIHRWCNTGSLIDEHGEAHHVSSCDRWVRVWQDGEAEASAHLIAAAPELYDMLASIENDAGQIPPEFWKKIQATLAKARGE